MDSQIELLEKNMAEAEAQLEQLKNDFLKCAQEQTERNRGISTISGALIAYQDTLHELQMAEKQAEVKETRIENRNADADAE